MARRLRAAGLYTATIGLAPTVATMVGSAPTIMARRLRAAGLYRGRLSADCGHHGRLSADYMARRLCASGLYHGRLSADCGHHGWLSADYGPAALRRWAIPWSAQRRYGPVASRRWVAIVGFTPTMARRLRASGSPLSAQRRLWAWLRADFYHAASRRCVGMSATLGLLPTRSCRLLRLLHPRPDCIKRRALSLYCRCHRFCMLRQCMWSTCYVDTSAVLAQLGA